MSQEVTEQIAVKIDADSMTYDRFTYHMWSKMEIARPFFKKVLPPRLRDNLKLETLRLWSSRTVDASGKEKIGDLFYLCDTKEGERVLLVIILEHKSYNDRYASIQTLGYAVNFLEQMKENRAIFENVDGRLPTPFCVVLCQNDIPQLSDLLYTVKGAEEFELGFSFLRVNMQADDFEDLRDSEPFLYMSLALHRFAYRVVETTDDAELLEIFSTILDLDPGRSENVSSYIRAFLAFTGWFMKQKRTNFQLERFTERLIEMDEQTTKTGYPRTLFQQIFASKLPEEMKQNLAKMDKMQEELNKAKDTIMTEQKRADSEKERADSEKERADNAEERADNAEERADNAEERADTEQERADNAERRAREAEEEKETYTAWIRNRICNDVKVVYGESDVDELSKKLNLLRNASGLFFLYDEIRPSGNLERFNKCVDALVAVSAR